MGSFPKSAISSPQPSNERVGGGEGGGEAKRRLSFQASLLLELIWLSHAKTFTLLLVYFHDVTGGIEG